MRIRVIVLLTAVLFFGAIVTVPRIIEASKSSATPVNSVVPSPVQGRKQDVTWGESIRNDTSIPVRDMKQQPVFKEKKEANKNPKIAHPHKDAPDQVVQTDVAAPFTAPNMPATIAASRVMETSNSMTEKADCARCFMARICSQKRNLCLNHWSDCQS